MSFDLRDVISEKDYRIMENYLETCHFPKDAILPVREYLSEWAKCKPKLYRMMGKNLKVSVPCTFEKPLCDIEKETYKLFNDFEDFINNYRKFFDNVMYNEEYQIEEDDVRDLKKIINVSNFIKDSIPTSIKIKPKGYKKTLQLQTGMKPIRALSKIVSYFGAENFKDFEEFRCKHSLIYNDKIIKGNLIISIHPLDFITMSDNSLGWSSCMSWTDDGCYHLGTVEMMNSNNVVVCYLEGSTPYEFNNEHPEDEEWTWNNKKWRQMFYVTKDIIVSGKAYPYKHLDLTRTVLEKLRELAKENFNWTYSFGPETYHDMKNIWSIFRMDNNREWVANGTSIKHNILFDTKNMYNDMLNDNNYEFLCVRNKVKKEKIISYSGKARCICCNDILLEENDYQDDYNDRFLNTGKVICNECLEKSRCSCCGKIKGSNNLIKIKIREFRLESVRNFCKDCYKERAKICPICGENFIVPDGYDSGKIFIPICNKVSKNSISIVDVEKEEYFVSELAKHGYPKTEPVIPGYCCKLCYDKMLYDKNVQEGLIVEEIKGYFSSNRVVVMADPVYDDYTQARDIQKYLYYNLKPAKK